MTINLPIRCEVPGGALFEGLAADLSIGGLYIEAGETPAFGTEITIVGDFPGAPGTRLPAVVRWMKPGGFGVQFGLLGARETHLLSGLVHQRAR